MTNKFALVHLHGHDFRVLFRQRAQKAENVNADTLSRFWKQPDYFTTGAGSTDPSVWWSGSNPVRRDTIMIYANSITVLEVNADCNEANPGA
jgi:FtsP/CotA-like multicopper oxidase with cupredoxin domain